MKDQASKLQKFLDRSENIKQKRAMEAKYELKETLMGIKSMRQKDEVEAKRIADFRENQRVDLMNKMEDKKQKIETAKRQNAFADNELMDAIPTRIDHFDSKMNQHSANRLLESEKKVKKLNDRNQYCKERYDQETQKRADDHN